MENAVKHIPAGFQQIAAKVAGVKVLKERTIVSLFSGCGGMDLGFLGGFEFGSKIYDRLPHRIKWANELDGHACNSYKHNLKHKIVQGDIWEIIENDGLPKSADIVLGGFPCQDFSIANKNRAGLDSDRGQLYRAMVDAVGKICPKVFVAENVKGILSIPGALDTIRKDFEDLGYKVSHHFVQAADYGVPQRRERVLIIGFRNPAKVAKFTFPTPDPHHTMTVEKAIGDLESAPECGETSHIWSRAKPSPDQGSRQLKADRPAHTIRAECHGNIQFHYKLPRRISMREAARLQSFPDNFRFTGGLRAKERQIGNAVPPVLAWHVAKAIHECLQ